MKPPYQLNARIIQLISTVSEKTGAINAVHLHKPPTELRKKNRIKTIHASLEIEGNTLTIEQITAILERKKVIGPQKDILEVKNAINVYEQLNKLNPHSFKSFCYAHKILMNGLIENAGRLRSKPVGIVQGKQVKHIAPSSKMLKPLLNDLFSYLKKDPEIPLIKSCVFHYEMVFIHPFMDGNGRMARLWQTLILKTFNPLFEFLPIETVIKERQSNYYKVLAASDNMGESTPFIEFMLETINDSLSEVLKAQNVSLTALDRIHLFKSDLNQKYFTRKDYLIKFKHISSATASRDLKTAVENGMLKKKGDKNSTIYSFK